MPEEVGRADVGGLEGLDGGECGSVDGDAVRKRRKEWSVPSILAASNGTEPPIADEARSMLQGVGSRFDYHVCKTLCDLRYARSSNARTTPVSNLATTGLRRSSTLLSTIRIPHRHSRT